MPQVGARQEAGKARWCLAIVLMAGSVVAGCTKPSGVASDPSEVELLRIQITKVRHAIDETRRAIATSSGAPYLPRLHVRLAELTSEEAKYHYRIAVERQRGASQDALHVPQVKLLKEQAIGMYQQVLSRYPEFDRTDRVLFYMAYEHRELGEYDKMTAALEKLAREHLTSGFRPQALLLLGDYHFDRSELSEAKGYYEDAVSGPHSRITGLAHYKLAWVWVNQGQCEPALKQFEKAVRAVEEEPSRDSAQDSDAAELAEFQQDIDVRRAAVVDLVYCYTDRRSAVRALEYFQDLSYDRATYIAALERLARRYGNSENAAGVLRVVRELLRLGPASQERMENVRQMHTSIRAQGKYERVGSDVALMTDAYVRYSSRVELDESERARLGGEFEVYVRDLLTRGQDRLRKASGPKMVEAATDLSVGYAAYLDAFPSAEKHLAMTLNAADIFADAGELYQAGQYSLSAASGLEGEKKRDALYDAVVRFQDSIHGKAARGAYADRYLAPSALRYAAVRLLRFPLNKQQRLRVRFALAESYYDQGDYREAIDRLTAVSYEFPKSTEAQAAVRLVLDSYNTLNDPLGLVHAGRRFLADGTPTPGLRSEIQPIVVAAEQRMVDEISLAAAGDDGGDLTRLLAFARQNKSTPLGERALLNAFVAARATGDSERMFLIGEEIAKNYPNSEQIAGILLSLGQMAVARFDPDRAQVFLRRAAASGHSQRNQLLIAVGDLYDATGDWEKARDVYLEAAKAEQGGARAAPLEKLSRLLERRGKYQELVRLIDEGDSALSLDLVATLAVAKIASGETEQAETLLQQVLGSQGRASPEALARAHYGMGELMYRTADQYPELSSPEFVEEYVAIVDIAQQSYVSAARQGDPEYRATALARLARLSELSARKLRTVRLPSEIDGATRAALRKALATRAKRLDQTAKEALATCRKQAWAAYVFVPAVRKCMAGQSVDFTFPNYDQPKVRRANAGGPSGVDALRARIAQNPEDRDALRDLGIRYLKSGDPHVAKMIFEAAHERGGGPRELNLLGIAHHRIGDNAAAMRAFARAAKGRLEAARQNLAKVLRQLSLQKSAERALAKFPRGRSGGDLLDSSDLR